MVSPMVDWLGYMMAGSTVAAKDKKKAVHSVRWSVVLKAVSLGMHWVDCWDAMMVGLMADSWVEQMEILWVLPLVDSSAE